MKERTKNLLKDRIIPTPQQIDVFDGAFYKLCDDCKITIRIPESVPAVAEATKQMASAFWDCEPEFVIDYTDNLGIVADGYELEVTADSITISAVDERGLRYAFYSLRQIAEPERGVREFSHYIIPQLQVRDAPGLAFRGVHLCWFPETDSWEIEKQIRLAAYYKMNYVVIETWGIFPFACEPDFCWQDRAVSQDEFKRLVALAAEIGITLVPQLNLLGHASWARGGTGKHAVLNLAPKYQSLYEPDGSCWCISNPETRTVLAALVTELHDVFGQPPFFHIGCDEAHSMASCSLCSEADITQVLVEHIAFFHDLFAERNTRVLMWHDMLLDKEDPRWQGYVAHGQKSLGVADLYKKLPDDMVICDWEYEIPDAPSDQPREWPTAKFFNAEGFQVVVCPWINEADILSIGKMAAEEKLFGLLATTWHKPAGNLYSIYFRTAEVAWNADYECFLDGRDNGNLLRHIRHVEADMNMTDYVGFGFLFHHQVSPAKAQD